MAPADDARGSMARGSIARGSMLSPREGRFVRVGALVGALALVTVYGVVPFARHWREREAQLGAERDRLSRLESLVAHRTGIDSAASAREAQLATLPQRVLRARSPALASASLQSMLQDLSEACNVTVTRLDVAGTSASSPPDGATAGNSGDARGGAQLPVTVSAVGDVYGLAAFLSKVRGSPRLVIVDRLSVQVNSALRGAPDVLQMTMSLHAPVIVE